VASIDKATIQIYLRHGLGQLVLDTSVLAIADDVLSIDSYSVSVHLRDIVLGDRDWLGERVTVYTVVERSAGALVYGGNLQKASPDDSFILFLRGSDPGFLMASVSNGQSILLGCFLIQAMDNVPAFLEAMQLLDQFLLPEESSLTEEFPEQPSLPGCTGCLFFLERKEMYVYCCGRLWIPASRQGWLTADALERYGEEYGPERPACWVHPPSRED
jgi:hypothetical protein